MKNKTFLRILCLSLALVALLGMAACGQTAPETQPQTTAPQETTTEATQPAAPAVSMTSFYMSMGENFDSQVYLNAYDNGDGTAYVEYAGAEKKVGQLEDSVLLTIFTEAQNAGVMALNGTEVYEEGEAMASLSISMADGTYCSANMGGTVSEEFKTAFAAMETVFQTLTADMPVYVPQAMVGEGVDAEGLAAMQEILNGANLPNLDGMTIMDVPVDENFGFAMGLSNTDGITSGTSCTPMMMTNAYSLVIAELADESKAADVLADFESSIDWRKWVCVAPTDALLAQKGNMVLCLMASDEVYTNTAQAAADAGWTAVKALENPDL